MSDSFADLVDAFEQRRAREEAELVRLRAENQRLRGALERVERGQDLSGVSQRLAREALAGDAE